MEYRLESVPGNVSCSFVETDFQPYAKPCSALEMFPDPTNSWDILLAGIGATLVALPFKVLQTPSTNTPSGFCPHHLKLCAPVDTN